MTFAAPAQKIEYRVALGRAGKVVAHNRRVERGNPGRWQEHLSRVLAAKFRFEALSRQPCLIVHYQSLSPALLKRVRARAVLVSGHITEATHYAEADLAGLRAVLRQAAQPTSRCSRIANLWPFLRVDWVSKML